MRDEDGSGAIPPLPVVAIRPYFLRVGESGVGGGDGEARTHECRFPVRGCRGAEIGRVSRPRDGDVEGIMRVDRVERGGRESGVVGFEELGYLEGRKRVGGEGGAIVCICSEDDGHVDEFSLCDHPGG